VAVTDRIPGGLSAVYTFYEPVEAARGLGTLAILRQLEWARREGLQHLYLGYWIEGHAKMDYKDRKSTRLNSSHVKISYAVFCLRSVAPSALPSLPTRRSSDLVAVTDRIPGGLSAVYTFYEPVEAARGLGTLAILRQLEWARREGLQHLYLGYWIEGHAKMDY